MPETKSVLKARRRQRLDGWLSANGLRLDEYPFWTTAQRDAEGAEFARLDDLYEVEKDALASELLAMSDAAREAFFEQVGWVPQGATAQEQVDDYLARA
ncbi:hypothetical protein FJZ36_16140 [Candidatus Poribacteria bacterium]|nr:hypothetical protein [Candidatus Poribacteria bacterium]